MRLGGQTKSFQTADPLPWKDTDGNGGEVYPLLASGLTANLLGQDILGEVEAYVTTDHKAFYEDLLEEQEFQQQFEEGRVCHPNYQDDPSFEALRRGEPRPFIQLHPQS